MAKLKDRLALGCGLVLLLSCLACQTSPQTKEARFLARGKEELGKKDYARAILDLKNAARAMPQDPEPYYQIGLAYLGAGDFRGALGGFQKTIELDPKRNDAQLKAAEIMTRYGNAAGIKEAQNKLEGLLAGNPNDPEVIDALGAVEFRLGKTDEAVKRLQDALQKFPADFRSTIELTQMRLRKNDTAGAIAVVQQAAASAPKSVPIAIAMGSLYQMLGKNAEAQAEFERVLPLDPKNPTVLLSLGKFQLAQKQFAEADRTYRQLAALPDGKYRFLHAAFAFRYQTQAAGLAEMENLAKTDKDSRAARNVLIFMYREMNKPEEVKRLVADALKHNPKDTDALFQKSGLELEAGNIAEAQKALLEVLHLRPDLAEAHYVLAAVYGAQGLHKNQSQQLNEALRLNNNLLAARLELSRLLRGANDSKGALELLNRTPPSQTSLPWVIERNWVLYQQGNLAELKTVLSRVLPTVRAPELLYQDALVKMRENNYAAARAAGEESLKIVPENVELIRLVADSYAAQNQLATGTQWFQDEAAKYPKSLPLQVELGEWYLGHHDLAGARRAFENAVSLDPGQAGANVELATLDYRDNHVDAARERLLGVIQREPAYQPARLVLGELEDAAGNQEAAVAQYRAVLATNEQDITAMTNLARDLATSQPDEALKLAQQAAEVAPNSALVLDTMGFILFRRNLYDEAADYLKRAVANRPTPQRQFHLAMLYMKSGQRTLAQPLLAGALQKDPNLLATEKAWQ